MNRIHSLLALGVLGMSLGLSAATDAERLAAVEALTNDLIERNKKTNEQLNKLANVLYRLEEKLGVGSEQEQ